MRLPRSPLVALVLVVRLATGASAQEPETSRGYILVGAGTALAGAFLLDHTIRAELALQRGEEPLPLAAVGTAIGKPGFFVPALAVLYGAGRLAGSHELAQGTAHATVALLASGVANGTLKFGIGRCRPRAPCDGDALRAFATDNAWQSFPSGHAVVAFSLATSLARKAKNPWVTAAAFSTAGFVGWSRVHNDRHWASDVVGGAIVGTGVTWLVQDWLEGRDAATRVGIGVGGLSVSVPAP